MLSSLTLEQKIKAFERARDAANITEGKLVLVTEEYYDDALELMKNFPQDEPISKSIDLQWTLEFAEMFMSSFREHLSLMLINSDTGEPMALRTIRIVRSNQGFEPEKAKDIGVKKIMAFIKYCDEKADFFGRTGSDSEAFHFMGLCTAPKYRHQGLATKIFNVAIQMVKYFELEKVCVKGEGTSNYSKRIYEKTGFETLSDTQFSDYVVDGEQVFCNTGDHTSMKVYGITIRTT